MKEAKKVMKYVVLYYVVGAVITLSWQAYEKQVYGNVTPDIFDSIIAVILTISIVLNVYLFRNWK